jgi:aminopeptidase YwaD
MTPSLRRLLLSTSLLWVLAPWPSAQAPAAPGDDGSPSAAATAGSAEASIADALAALDGDVREYNDHVVVLASPFMEGRVPGSRGMEIASEYVEHWYRQAGLEAPFQDEQGEGSYRQPFALAATPEIVSQHIEVPGSDAAFAADVDFRAMGLGGSGDVTGELVFVGYSISDGPDGYESFADGDDLTGKVALMLRFEPMDSEGKSLWASGRSPWSGRAGFNRKFSAIKERNPAAVILVNTPGAADSRVEQLISVNGGGRQTLDGPVAMIGYEAADRLMAAVAPNGPSLMDLRELADGRGGVIPLDTEVRLAATIERNPIMAENVGGLLPGRGELAGELLVMGAHLDHLGMGNFGSRSGAGELHPGADDNASGSAAIIMLAEKLAADYADLPEGVPARSVLFLCFSAEESGLNGARHYVDNPIVPLDQHALMVNFDMIGRIKDKRLSVSGTNTADGFSDWLAPYFDASALEIVQPANMSGASDHSAFYSREIPVLFGIIADFHDDYHTPRDVSWKINRVDAVHTVDLFHEIGLAAATRPEPFVYKEPLATRAANALASVATGQGGPEMPDFAAIKVRFGIAPGSLGPDETGVLVSSVSEGTSASEAGIRVGDRLTTWNGEEIPGVLDWMASLAGHDPGDKVQVGVRRDDELLTLWVTLKARGGAGG